MSDINSESQSTAENQNSEFKKKHKLIVRNLSFEAKEDDIRNEFAKFGLVRDVYIPHKQSGKARGFAFVEFHQKNHLLAAITHVNGREFFGRKVAVDYHIPNVVYRSTTPKKVKRRRKKKVLKVSEEKKDDEEDKKSDEEDQKNDEQEKKPEDYSTTLFIRNVSFDSMEEDLEEALEQFGDMLYCKIVIDKEGRPKGTAFVKFADNESTEKCLNESLTNGITVDGRKLMFTSAISRDEASKLTDDKKTSEKTKKDKRNLHLLQEGFIANNSDAYQALSKEDKLKRNRIEMLKKAKLKNPLIFVSDTRICIHNIPKSVTDAELSSKIFNTIKNDDLKITECRIMRDMSKINKAGLGQARGFAFVNFNSPDQALTVLRTLNNNADIFGDLKRPIVEFALENKQVLELQRKRRERIQNKKPDDMKVERKPKFLKPKKKRQKVEIEVIKPEVKTARVKKDVTVEEKRKKKKKVRNNRQVEIRDDFDKLVNDYRKKINKSLN